MTKQGALVHLLFPDIFEFKGGIQVYSAFLLKALQNLYPANRYQVFLKHDTHALASFNQQTKFHFSGSVPLPLRTVFFAAQILGFGWLQRPQLTISTHVNFTPAAYLLKRLAGVPYWTVAHGTEAWDIKSSAIKTALHHADRILTVSSYTRDRLLKEQNLDPSKISLLPCTFEASQFKIAPKPLYLLNRYQLTAEQPIILTVGRLDNTQQYKGYDQIFLALPAIRRQLPNIHYILVGKGNDRPNIEKLITKLNLQDCVTLAGFVPDEELSDYYNLCDVFAMPSKGEGFGIVYLEALACGKPTLGGNQDGATDALCHGELGVLVNPDDLTEITETLVKILQKKHPLSILYQPEQLRQKMIEKFSFDCFQEKLAEVLQNSKTIP